MKNIVILFSLLFIACEPDAVVLSADGSTEIAFCNSDNPVVPCINKYCPTGSVAVKNNSQFAGPTVVRCKE